MMRPRWYGVSMCACSAIAENAKMIHMTEMLILRLFHIILFDRIAWPCGMAFGNIPFGFGTHRYTRATWITSTKTKIHHRISDRID